jgi:hypothetical protein
MCNSTQQLSFVLNQYYTSQDSRSDACDFGGDAVIKESSDPSGTCKDLIDEAGSAGTGTVTSSPTAKSGSGSGSSGSGSSTSKGAAGYSAKASAEASLLPVVFMGALAILSGCGMIML